MPAGLSDLTNPPLTLVSLLKGIRFQSHFGIWNIQGTYRVLLPFKSHLKTTVIKII